MVAMKEKTKKEITKKRADRGSFFFFHFFTAPFC